MINPYTDSRLPIKHAASHLPAGQDPLTGHRVFIISTEADSAETVSNVGEVTKATLSLPANSYTKIYIEFAGVHRYEVDVTAKMNATWKINYNAILQKTFNAKILALATSGCDTGQKESIYGSVIMAGGQAAAADVTITGQIDVNNANAGYLLKFCRIWGII